MTIALLDPTIASENLGDQIIREAVTRILTDLMPQQQIIHLSTQDIIGRRSVRLAGKARHRIVGGTNLLSSRMLSYRQWNIGLLNAWKVGPAVLMGVGWWQYQPKPDLYTRLVLRNALSSEMIHAVRDDYTKTKLAGIGIRNALNTSCPTTWGLSEEHCRTVPKNRSDAVVLTLTDYKPDPEADRELVRILLSNYKTVYFWPQGSGDWNYLYSLGLMDQVKAIYPSLEQFDDLLKRKRLDYVGTRLHAGIRALQYRRRTLILAVDNRGAEISSDIGLPVIDRSEISSVAARVSGDFETRLTLPVDAIGQWKAQFQDNQQIHS